LNFDVQESGAVSKSALINSVFSVALVLVGVPIYFFHRAGSKVN